MAKALKEDNVKIQVTVSKRLLEQLQKVAEVKDLTVSALVRLAAAEYIQRENSSK